MFLNDGKHGRMVLLFHIVSGHWFSSGITFGLFTLNFIEVSRDGLSGVWNISGSIFSSKIVWTCSTNGTFWGYLGALWVIFGTGTLGVDTGVNVMDAMVYFGFFTLKYGAEVCLRIMHASCSMACTFWSPMVSTGPAGCGFCSYTMMSDSAFLMPYILEVSGIGNKYENNSTISEILDDHVFTT